MSKMTLGQELRELANDMARYWDDTRQGPSSTRFDVLDELVAIACIGGLSSGTCFVLDSLVDSNTVMSAADAIVLLEFVALAQEDWEAESDPYKLIRALGLTSVDGTDQILDALEARWNFTLKEWWK